MVISPRDSYAVGMFDIMTPRNPLHKSVTVIFNSINRDQYNDARVIEESRQTKVALVEKDDQHFIQFFDIEELLEDTDKPWTVTLSITDLPRLPRTDDRMLIDGLLYTVSQVKPINREMPSVVKCLIYPERNEFDRVLGSDGELLPVGVTFHRISGNNWTPVSILVTGETYVMTLAPRGRLLGIKIRTGSSTYAEFPSNRLEIRFDKTPFTKILISYDSEQENIVVTDRQIYPGQ